MARGMFSVPSSCPLNTSFIPSHLNNQNNTPIHFQMPSKGGTAVLGTMIASNPINPRRPGDARMHLWDSSPGYGRKSVSELVLLETAPSYRKADNHYEEIITMNIPLFFQLTSQFQTDLPCDFWHFLWSPLYAFSVVFHSFSSVCLTVDTVISRLKI